MPVEIEALVNFGGYSLLPQSAFSEDPLDWPSPDPVSDDGRGSVVAQDGGLFVWCVLSDSPVVEEVRIIVDTDHQRSVGRAERHVTVPLGPSQPDLIINTFDWVFLGELLIPPGSTSLTISMTSIDVPDPPDMEEHVLTLGRGRHRAAPQ